jgi:glycosyltransferase involved in cell wall biosynthesis
MTSSHRLKLLFLLPFAPDLRGSHGGARATAAIIEMLSKDHRVCVLYLSSPGDPPARQLPSDCERMLAVDVARPAKSVRSLAKRFRDAIGHLFWREPEWVESAWSPLMASEAAAVAAEFEPDIVYFEFHVMAQYIAAVRAAFPRAKMVVTEHEPGITADDKGGGSSALWQRLGGLARKRAWRRYERRALRQADAIVVFTESDAAALDRLLGPDRPQITVIPLRLPADAPRPAKGKETVESDFLFVGNFRHPPNADAARRLVSGIFPLIQRDLPDATLYIVGANPPQDVIDAASDSVAVTGWVDDPSVYLAGAKIVLVPLRQGGGLRVKMLEACAAGTAIIASRMAVEGLSLADGKEVLIAETDEEFAAKAVALMANPENRAQLAAASRRWSDVEQGSDLWSAQYAAFHATLAKSGDDGNMMEREAEAT